MWKCPVCDQENDTAATVCPACGYDQTCGDNQPPVPERLFRQYLQESDQARQMEYLKASAEQGYAPAQRELGNCYFRGHGVDPDYTQAVQWFRKAAEQGHKDARRALADCYANGWGVPEDPSLAAYWREKAENDILAGKSRK